VQSKAQTAAAKPSPALLALQRGRGNHYMRRLLDGSSANGLDERTRSRLERVTTLHVSAASGPRPWKVRSRTVCTWSTLGGRVCSSSR
jgi:hypothetical protein